MESACLQRNDQCHLACLTARRHVSEEMREYFGQFGQIKRCLLPFDKDTGFHKGFCWVSFTSEEGLFNALQKDPHIIEETKLQVGRNRQSVPRRLIGEVEES
uniref:SRA stem-loop interacting RNA binding protein n=1 Tax=Paramormyrops kingsleyae TaxID=1676925 RepID=A0A3B3S6B3_9TELE